MSELDSIKQDLESIKNYLKEINYTLTVDGYLKKFVEKAVQFKYNYDSDSNKEKYARSILNTQNLNTIKNYLAFIVLIIIIAGIVAICSM